MRRRRCHVCHTRSHTLESRGRIAKFEFASRARPCNLSPTRFLAVESRADLGDHYSITATVYSRGLHVLLVLLVERESSTLLVVVP